MPGPTAVPTPEPQVLWFPLGVWIERFFVGLVTYCLYSSLYFASKLFRPFRLAGVKKLAGNRLPELLCPKGYSDWADPPHFGCMADVAQVINAAKPVTWILLGAGFCCLALVLVRKARDAGVTLSLPWVAPETAGESSSNRHPETPGRPSPSRSPRRPAHAVIPWWIEAALMVMTATSLFVFFLIVWKLIAHPPRLPEHADNPVCDDGQWSVFPKWVYYYTPKTFSCVDSWTLVLLGSLYAFNSLIAAGLNGLALILIRRELLTNVL